jgi:hypothetical protein
VLTLDHAATTLAATDTLDGLHTLAHTLGVRGRPIALPAALRQQLIAHSTTLDAARVIVDHGPLGALIARTITPVDLRPLTQTLATTLARHTPLHRWLLCLASPTRTIVATWSGTPPTVRIAALTVERDLIRPSDADTLRLLAAARDADPHTTHQRWLDTLRRDSLGNRFYQAVATTLDDLATSAAPPRGTTRIPATTRRELALLTTSRLLFLAFLEAKGWLHHDRHFLRRQLDHTLTSGGRVHQRLLAPLCFGTLNTPRRKRAPAALAFGDIPFLNGGLFARTPLERQTPLLFADAPLSTLIADVLGGFRFTTHESAPGWHDAAIDPAMLGRTFESLMATDERKRFGTFFTPTTLVDETLDRALAELGEHPSRTQLQQLTVLDPACGSGAFLVRALERIADLLATAGDTRPVDQRRREVLTRSIFGIDRHPLAIWLCELRLWLSVVIDLHATHTSDIPPLPNLDHHLHVGDALAGGDFTHATPAGTRLATLRLRYTRATGSRKRSLARTIAAAEREQAHHTVTHELTALQHERREQLALLRRRDLFGERPAPTTAHTRARLDRRIRTRELLTLQRALTLGSALPFRADAHFADVAARGGFDLIIGNPPWVRPHHMDRETRARIRRDFRVARSTPTTNSPRSFGLQVDLAACFTERSLRLLRPHGTLALLLPAKLWRSLAGGPLRALLTRESTVRQLHDLADGPAVFAAATYPSLLIAQRPTTTPQPTTHTVTASVARTTTRLHFSIPARTLPLDTRPDAPWIVTPPHVRHALDTIRHAGVPLARHTGPPRLGVKCGVNAAFLVTPIGQCGDRTRISDGTRSAWIESALLRPVLRGEDLARRTTSPTLALIYPHHPDHTPLHPLPPLATRWFAPLRNQLAARTDARHARHWYTLFRLDSSRPDQARLAWADIGRQLTPRLLPTGSPHVLLNSCYATLLPHDDDALALLALLSAPITSAILALIAEPARGGYRRFLGHSVAQLPLPTHDALHHHHPQLVALGRMLHNSNSTTPSPALAEQLDHAFANALDIPHATFAPIHQWHRPA